MAKYIPKYRQYVQRKDDIYKLRLYELFSSILDLTDLKIQTDIDKWKVAHTSMREKNKVVNGVEYTHTLNIDFIGLAATTILLGDLRNPDTKSPGHMVSQAFKRICGDSFTATLKQHKILLRARLIFPYPYSNFFHSLIESIESKKGGSIYDRNTNYDFNTEDLRSRNIDSKIRRDQTKSLKVIQRLTTDNENLIITNPANASHTLQIRFTCLPITVCSLMVGNTAFTDPYLFLNMKKQDEILFYYPVTESNAKDRSSTLYFAIAKSFDYYWSNELTIFCNDATHFEKDLLQKVKTPNEVIQFGFKQRIKRTLEHLKIVKTDADIIKWSNALIKKFLSNCESYPISNAQGNIGTNADSDSKMRNSFEADIDNSIEIGFKRIDGKEYFYFNLKAGGISFLEFKKEKLGTLPKTNLRVGYPYKILLHYCLVAKGILIKGSMFESGNVDYEEQHKPILKALRPLAGDMRKKINRLFLKEYILDFDVKLGTSLKLKNITVNIDEENFRALTYDYYSDTSKKLIDKMEAYVIPEEYLAGDWEELSQNMFG